MAVFPDEVFSIREIENLPGIIYDETNKKTLFAEDIQNISAEVSAIESYIIGGGGGGGAAELPVGSIFTTTADPADGSPFSYGDWELLASGQFFGNKITHSWERIS